tara:strand:- start:74107 stop:74223 length:117 start_codon:yes stop_codon:yes gene_type:complete
MIFLRTLVSIPILALAWLLLQISIALSDLASLVHGRRT